MANKDKYRKTELSDFFDYSEEKLKSQDRNALERQMEKDSFEAEAAEGLSMISREEAEKDMLELSRRIRGRINRRKRIAWYSAAAAIASLLIVGTAFFNLIDLDLNRDAAMENKSLNAENEYAVDNQEETVTEFKSVEESEKNETESKKIASKNEVSHLDEEEASPVGSSEENETPEKEKITDLLQKEQLEQSDKQKQDLSTRQVQAQQKRQSKKTELGDEERLVSTIQEKEEKVTAPKGMAKDAAVGERREVAAPVSLKEVQIPVMEEVNLAEDIEEKDIEEKLSGRVAGVLVSAEDNEPLPGVSVVVKGTTIGTVTDMDGNFELDMSESDENKVVASYIGMESKEITVTDNEKMTIVMEPSTESLEEVVVTGYGTERKRQTTGSVQKIEPNKENKYKSAYPVNGMAKFKRMLDTTLHFPDTELEGDKAVVVLKFIIGSGGRPYDIEVVKSPGEEFSKEAIRVIENGPDWVPASRDGNYSAEHFRLRIVFRRKT